MMMRLTPLFFLLILGGFCSAKEYAKIPNLEKSLDSFVVSSKVLQLTPRRMEELYENEKYSINPYYQWLNKEKTRAIFKRHPYANLSIDLSIINGKVPVDELIVDFQDGEFAGCTVSVFNKGDSGELSGEEFKRRITEIGKLMNNRFGSKPRARKTDLEAGIIADAYIWSDAKGNAVLDYNVEAPEGQVGFVRLRYSKSGVGGIYAAALEDKPVATVSKNDLGKNVKKSASEVVIENIPMADQGVKGYCVVASVQRVFEYYGIATDMHQFAEITATNVRRGTDPLLAYQNISKIDHLFQTELTCLAVRDGERLANLKDDKYNGDTVSQEEFEQHIVNAVDQGIPLIWSLVLGKYKETPKLTNQLGGGHMRLITGYDLKNRKLFFTDSWGIGHEKKWINLDHAYLATTGLFALVPTEE